jgi:hypothetical protein
MIDLIGEGVLKTLGAHAALCADLSSFDDSHAIAREKDLGINFSALSFAHPCCVHFGPPLFTFNLRLYSYEVNRDSSGYCEFAESLFNPAQTQ